MDNNSLKLISTAINVARKLKKIEDKITKDIGLEEITDILEDGSTILDPSASLAEKAMAAADLLIGTELNSKKTKVTSKVDGKDIDKLKNKDNWTSEQIKQANIKKQNLQKAAQDGKLTVNSNHGVTNVKRAKVTQQYRKDLTNRINSLYANNPNARKNALQKLDNADIDHMIDLQLGGDNVRGNLKALDKSVNRSYGKQLDNILKDLVKNK